VIIQKEKKKGIGKPNKKKKGAGVEKCKTKSCAVLKGKGSLAEKKKKIRKMNEKGAHPQRSKERTTRQPDTRRQEKKKKRKPKKKFCRKGDFARGKKREKTQNRREKGGERPLEKNTQKTLKKK